MYSFVHQEAIRVMNLKRYVGLLKAVWTSFESSFIAGIAWEDHTLFVRMDGGTVYAYHDVPRSVFKEFMDAPSKGAFYNGEVKGVYEGEKVVNKEPVRPATSEDVDAWEA